MDRLGAMLQLSSAPELHGFVIKQRQKGDNNRHWGATAPPMAFAGPLSSARQVKGTTNRAATP